VPSESVLNSGESVVSVSGKRIRLTDERWRHIERRHPELRGSRENVLEAVRDPNFVVKGRYGEALAVRSPAIGRSGICLVVVYRESSKDGFIITAFLTSDVRDLEQRERLWPSPF
jgi:hypothetical protein